MRSLLLPCRPSLTGDQSPTHPQTSVTGDNMFPRTSRARGLSLECRPPRRTCVAVATAWLYRRSEIAEGDNCCVVTRSSPKKFISIRKLTTLILTWVIHLCSTFCNTHTCTTQAWSVLMHNSVKSLSSWRLWRHYRYRYRWRSKVSVSVVSVISGIGLSLAACDTAT